MRSLRALNNGMDEFSRSRAYGHIRKIRREYTHEVTLELVVRGRDGGGSAHLKCGRGSQFGSGSC